MALWLFAHGIAFWASAFLAMLNWATNFALRLVAFNLALGASEFLAARGALGRLTYRLAHLITYWFVTFPLALGVTVVTFSAVSSSSAIAVIPALMS